MSEFYSIRDVKSSKKNRRCDECGNPIYIGQPYRQCSGKDEGQFWMSDVHAECQIWASAVIYDCGEGRGLLCDESPEDDLEPDDLIRRIKDNPPSDVMISRLPKQWLAFVQRALFEGVDGEAS